MVEVKSRAYVGSASLVCLHFSPNVVNVMILISIDLVIHDPGKIRANKVFFTVFVL